MCCGDLMRILIIRFRMVNFKSITKPSLILVFIFCIHIYPFSKTCSQSKSEMTIQDTLTKEVKRLPSPKSAMIRSIIFPGWGQWYNGIKWKAALVFATETGIIGASIYWNNRLNKSQVEANRILYRDYRNQSYWFLGLAILISMGDAYIDAHLAGFDVSPDLSFREDDKKFKLNFSFKY